MSTSNSDPRIEARTARLCVLADFVGKRLTPDINDQNRSINLHEAGPHLEEALKQLYEAYTLNLSSLSRSQFLLILSYHNLVLGILKHIKRNFPPRPQTHRDLY
jgi:hypothetical protein